MQKKDELTKGCMAKALDEEMTFVLLARDSAAPSTILHWCEERVLHGKNKWCDPQIQEALECVNRMREQRASGMFRKPIPV